MIERLQIAMCKTANQPDWKSLVAAAGKPMGLMMQQARRLQQPHKIIQTALLLARIELYENVNDSVAKLDELRARHHQVIWNSVQLPVREDHDRGGRKFRPRG